jgi:hypothetical protein
MAEIPAPCGNDFEAGVDFRHPQLANWSVLDVPCRPSRCEDLWQRCLLCFQAHVRGAYQNAGLTGGRPRGHVDTPGHS